MDEWICNVGEMVLNEVLNTKNCPIATVFTTSLLWSFIYPDLNTGHVKHIRYSINYLRHLLLDWEALCIVQRRTNMLRIILTLTNDYYPN